MRAALLALLLCGCSGWRDAHPGSEYPAPPKPNRNDWGVIFANEYGGPIYPSGWVEDR